MFFYHGDSWYGVDSYNVHLLKDAEDDTSCFEEEYKTFTLRDVIELLPESIKVKSSIYNLSIDYYANEFIIHYTYDYEPFIQFNNNDILQAVYNVLLWIIENGFLKAK